MHRLGEPRQKAFSTSQPITDHGLQEASQVVALVRRLVFIAAGSPDLRVVSQ